MFLYVMTYFLMGFCDGGKFMDLPANVNQKEYAVYSVRLFLILKDECKSILFFFVCMHTLMSKFVSKF